MGIHMKVCLISLGCDKNLADSEIMISLLQEQGHTMVEAEENADAMANKLRSMGYPVAIELSKDLYAVKVGEYDDLDDARELEQQLRRMGYDTLLVSR